MQQRKLTPADITQYLEAPSGNIAVFGTRPVAEVLRNTKHAKPESYPLWWLRGYYLISLVVTKITAAEMGWSEAA
jgi:hypothetical protein